MNPRQAAQQALEALEIVARQPVGARVTEAIAALKQALAEPETVMHQYKYQAYGYYKEDGKLKLGTIPEPQTTHWEGCEAVHPECKKPEQEPVAWRITDGEGDWEYRTDLPEDWSIQWSARYGRKYEPLYTAPTPRKVLTDEEIDRVTDQQWASNNHKPMYAAHRAYARAIERKHGIGGGE